MKKNLLIISLIMSAELCATAFGCSDAETDDTADSGTDGDTDGDSDGDTDEKVNIVWKNNGLFHWNGKKITPITGTSSDASTYSISGKYIVWEKYISSTPNVADIYLWDGSTSTKIISDGARNALPFKGDGLYNNNFVWGSNKGGQEDLYFWNGSAKSRITNDAALETNFCFHKGKAAWSKDDGNDNEIYFWDGSNIVQVTDNAFDDGDRHGSLKISDNYLVWIGSTAGDKLKLFYWDGSKVGEITEWSKYDQLDFSVSGHNVTWAAKVGNVTEIFFWNGSTVTQITHDSSHYNQSPRISGNNIIWVSGGLFFWDGTKTTQITDKSPQNFDHQISGNNVVWGGNDGNDVEIYFWDGKTITKVTENETDDIYPKISL